MADIGRNTQDLTIELEAQLQKNIQLSELIGILKTELATSQIQEEK
jgi:hypothetical protein